MIPGPINSHRKITEMENYSKAKNVEKISYNFDKINQKVKSEFVNYNKFINYSKYINICLKIKMLRQDIKSLILN